MKSTTIKKTVCVLLSILTVFALPVSAFAASGSSVPVIYIGEMSDNALYINPNKNGATSALDINSSDFTGDMASIVGGVVLSMFTDVATGTTSVLNGINAIMDPILCAPNGESQNSAVGPWEYYGPISEHKDDAVYNDNIASLVENAGVAVNEKQTYFFSYDWRLDPLSNALKLKEYIDYVETYSRSSKVSLLCVGYGGVIANSYLCTYEAHASANIESCVFYNCPLTGNAIVGDFMKGRVARIIADEDSLSGMVGTINGAHRGEAFFNFMKDDATGLVSGIFENLLGEGSVTTLVGKAFLILFSTIAEGQDLHKEIGKAYNNFALNADYTVYGTCLREALRNMPGLWALVPEKDYQAAIDFLYEDEFINDKMLDKLTAYREVQSSTQKTLRTAQLNGINVCVVANYGFQLLPVTISLDDMSDGIESVKYASAGAVTLDNSDESGHMNNCVNSKHNHLSPDEDIHAAYCALPENTWFIKGVAHGDMTDPSVAQFIGWLLSASSQRHIRENASYTQYMKYSTYTNKLSPYTTPGDSDSYDSYGDLDMDGLITAADARIVLRMSVGLESSTKEQKLLADVDGDNSVTAADARLVLRCSVGLEYGFPV